MEAAADEAERRPVNEASLLERAIKVRDQVVEALATHAPEPTDEVTQFVEEMGLQQKHVDQIYRSFRKLKKSEAFGAGIGPREVLVSAVPKLVKRKRFWVAGMLVHLMKLGGFYGTITWDGFLYLMVQFCSLSKVEICQMMYFIITLDVRSWTVHSITVAQLEDFYDFYSECPVPAFSTAIIDFSRLPHPRYNMVEFVQLCFSFSQLVNPCIHLQRDLRQVLPGMAFWVDYDSKRFQNRKLGMDFFRHKKMISILEAVKIAHGKSIAMDEGEAMQYKQLPTALPPRPRDTTMKTPANFVPLPLGPEKPRVDRPEPEPQRPKWMVQHLQQNFDPVRGVALGTAAEALREQEIAPALPPGWVAVPDPEAPKRLYFWNQATNEVSWQAPPMPSQTVAQAKEALSATIGQPISRAAPGGFKVGLVNKPTARDDSIREAAAQRTKELDFVRDARKHELAAGVRTHDIGMGHWDRARRAFAKFAGRERRRG